MRNFLYLYSPARVRDVFFFLLTVFLLIKKKKSFLGLKPLTPLLLRETIVKLGASFIKLAQVLATRADFFSGEYLEKLKELHDEIPPMDKKSQDEVFKRAFKDSVFESFESEPIASASIGQVHKAILKDKTEVAVKLRRKGIKKRVEADIKILKFFNTLFYPLFSSYTKNSIEAVIVEFSAMILQEVDFENELKNLNQFRITYAQNDVIFPTPYDKFCSKDAIVMSFEHGYRFDDKENLEKLNISFTDIMDKLILFYVDQMLMNGYFHADPHPGNLLVKEDGGLVFLDFGMVKKIPNSTRIAIIEMIKSANDKDFDLYITACKRLGVIAHNAPQTQMENLAEQMFDIFSDENLDAVNMQTMAFDIMGSMKDMPFKLPQEAIFILRVSAIIEGLGTTHIKNFNGVKDILPVLQSHIPKALGADRKVVKLLKSEIAGLPLTFKRVKKIVTDLSEGALSIQLSNDTVEHIVDEHKKYLKPIILGSLFIVTAFFMQSFFVEIDSVYSIVAFVVGIGFVLYGV